MSFVTKTRTPSPEPPVKTRLVKLWRLFRSSYWFLPTLMAMVAIIAAISTTTIDAVIPFETAERFGWLYSGGAEGARSILSTVAGSMITIAGVVFSITIVVLSLTSTQFGPRLLNKFMRDTGTQVVLGTFIATFIYCLFVLRGIRTNSETSFIPHLSVTFAFLLALAGTAVLIYFIHHVAAAIQADSIISSVYSDVERTINRLFPDVYESENEMPVEENPEAALPEGFEETAVPLVSQQNGYLQRIDYTALAKSAEKHDLVIQLHCRPGGFVVEGARLLSAWPAEQWQDELAGQLSGAFILGRHRTDEQDMEYGMKQMVEVALRALSPGINDPFTAMTCIDWLSVAVARISRRKFPSSLRFDDEGKLRLVLVPISFAAVVEGAFGQLRQAAAHHVQVILRLLDAIRAIAPHVRSEDQRAVLENYAMLTVRRGIEESPVADDERVLNERYRMVLEALGNNGGSKMP